MSFFYWNIWQILKSNWLCFTKLSFHTFTFWFWHNIKVLSIRQSLHRTMTLPSSSNMQNACITFKFYPVSQNRWLHVTCVTSSICVTSHTIFAQQLQSYKLTLRFKFLPRHQIRPFSFFPLIRICDWKLRIVR